MVVVIECTDPRALLSAMRDRMTRGYEGVWWMDLDGDLVYSGPDTRLLTAAVLRPVVGPGTIRVEVVRWKAQKLTRPVVGGYVTAFVGMVVTHFSTWVKRVVVEMG